MRLRTPGWMRVIFPAPGSLRSYNAGAPFRMSAKCARRAKKGAYTYIQWGIVVTIFTIFNNAHMDVSIVYLHCKCRYIHIQQITVLFIYVTISEQWKIITVFFKLNPFV